MNIYMLHATAGQLLSVRVLSYKCKDLNVMIRCINAVNVVILTFLSKSHLLVCGTFCHIYSFPMEVGVASKQLFFLKNMQWVASTRAAISGQSALTASFEQDAPKRGRGLLP